ncbi:mechanosensitive ion channel family protein [Wenxinia marina]|uniref:Small-conductance mechanosensitive channel n=1 Tax=Wenxinia marina DSM 24838 TaxID=1123501 RepID=A0A0D0NMK1_9RHOB|nr:mechanosensitive ion channel domain-containing protein [Wenxinia marina]KIQ69535.1 Small-conductance mechanosensitive channel [Wenxinia marina DSM 24838]GGL59153.1 mechanosensitive ion channel protein MscS [Wenxinia marina]
MIRARLAALVAALLLALAGAVAAQDVPPDVPPGEVVGPAGQTALAPERAEWRQVVERTTAILEQGEGSSFGLERLRAELVSWRDQFLAGRDANAGRIETVASQLDALGAPPEEGEEPERIAERRAALQGRLADLRAPRLLAAEAAAEASGLISEIDAQLRREAMGRLFDRLPTVLDLAAWGAAGALVVSRVDTLATETAARFAGGVTPPDGAVPGALLLAVAGLVLLTFGLRLTRRAVGWSTARTAWAGDVARIVASLGYLLLPTAGASLLIGGIIVSRLPGPLLSEVLQDVPWAVLNYFAALWVADSLFAPEADAPVPLDFKPERRRRVRRRIVWIGLLSAIVVLLASIGRIGEADPAAAALILMWPRLAIAALLFLVARDFLDGAQSGGEEELAETAFRRALLSLVARVAMVAAVVGSLLLLVGYAAAGSAVISDTTNTLLLLAILILIEKLVFDLYVAVAGPEAGQSSLIPVILGGVLVILAVPMIAILWGVRPEELAELWSRFRAGFQIGETRLSPTEFLTFVIVFALGYGITRLIQSSLRSVLLPRTRMDIGARNALVAGAGYLGIFAAALLAVISAGFDLSSLVVIFGALSVGIGFGLQNIVSNFVSGIILLIERPISEGDWIEVNGQMGYVRDISVRSTRIETFDRTDVIVPNADLISGQVTNWTRGNLVGRVIVPVGVAYGSDTEKVTAILREVAEAHPMVVLTPPPTILFRTFGDSSLNFEIRAILRDVNFVLNVQSEMNHEIARRFAEAGIEVPFPQRDLWLRNPQTLRGET